MEELKNYCTPVVVFRSEYLLILVISLILALGVPIALGTVGLVNSTNITNVTASNSTTMLINIIPDKTTYFLGELANITVNVLENGLPYTGMGYLSIISNNTTWLGANLAVVNGLAKTGVFLDLQSPGNYSVKFSVGNFSNTTNITIVPPENKTENSPENTSGNVTLTNETVGLNQNNTQGNITNITQNVTSNTTQPAENTSETQESNQTNTENETQVTNQNTTESPFIHVQLYGSYEKPLIVKGTTNLNGTVLVLVRLPTNETYLDTGIVKDNSFNIITNLTLNVTGTYIANVSIGAYYNQSEIKIIAPTKPVVKNGINIKLDKVSYKKGDTIHVTGTVIKNGIGFTGFVNTFVKKGEKIISFASLPVINGKFNYAIPADFDTPGYYTLVVALGGTSKSLGFYYEESPPAPMPNPGVPPQQTSNETMTNETSPVEVNISVGNMSISNTTGLITTNVTIPELGSIRVFTKSKIKSIYHINRDIIKIETENKTDKLDIELPFTIPKGLHYYAWVKTDKGFRLASIEGNKVSIKPNSTSAELYIAKPPEDINVKVTGKKATAKIGKATLNMKTNQGNISQFEIVAPNTIPNNTKSFPYGLVKFNITGVSGEAKINITFDKPVAKFGEYWKFKPETMTWLKMPFKVLNNYTIQITIKDNGPFDADPRVGYISDDSGFETSWWNYSWDWRQVIPIVGSSTNLTNYQVELTIDTATLISEGKMNANCSDIRFTYWNTTSSTEAVMPYYLLDGCNTTTTHIWVKIPFIRAATYGNETIFMYYGNPNATTSESNFSAVWGLSTVTAAYNTTLGAPSCDNYTKQCVAPSSLLECNDNQAAPGPEPDEPNTIDTCTDSATSGTCHSDESVENITVTDLNGTAFLPGDTVRVNVTAYCWGTNDYIAAFYTNSTTNVSWVRISPTGITCQNSGDYETFSFTFKLDNTSGYQAVRGVIKYSADISTPCDGATYSYTDQDDVAFRVMPRANPEPSPSKGIEEYKNDINISITLPPENANVTRFVPFDFNATINRLRGTINNLQAWAEVVSSSSQVESIVENKYEDFATYSSKTNITVAHDLSLQIKGDTKEIPWWNSTFPYRQYIDVVPPSDSKDLVVNLKLSSSNVGPDFNWTSEHLRFVYYNRTSGNFDKLSYWVASWDSTGQTASIWVRIPYAPANQNYTISMYYGNPNAVSESNFDSVFGSTTETAYYDSTLGAPICDNATESCVAPSSLLECNDNQAAPGPEPDHPNTIDTCTDSATSGTCHSDESVENITVTDLNGTAFLPGDTVRVNVTAYCWGTTDYIAVFYTNSTSNINWIRVSPTGVTCANSGDYETFSYTFKLNSTSGYHAVRGVIKYSADVTTPCDTGSYIDKDDVAFKVLPSEATLTYRNETSLDYSNPGEYISNAFDTGATSPTWGKIYWNSVTNANTSISVYTRSSADGVTWSAWYAQTNNTTIQAPQQRYLQYKIDMSTTNTKQTPILQDITLKYVGTTQSWQIMNSTGTDFTTNDNPNTCPDLNSTNTQCNVSWVVTPRELGPYSIRIYANNSDIEKYSIVRNVTVWAKTYVDSFTSNKTVIGRGRTVHLVAHLTNDLSEPLSGRNITFYDETDSKLIGYAVTNSTGYAVIDYTIPKNATIGYHTWNASYGGNTSEYLLPSYKTISVKVSSVPQFVEVGTKPKPGWLGYNLTVYANVTDVVGVDTVKINVTYPNGTLIQANMINVGGSLYEYNVTNTWTVGTYTYSIWANNTDGVSNSTGIKNFVIDSYANFDFRTEKKIYKNYELVHLNITTNESWWNTSWQYRLPINISSTVNLTNYQVEIDLNNYNFNLNLCEANGSDLRFLWYNSTSGTYEKIPYWVEEWNTTSGEARVWIKVPKITSDTKIYMYYGNPNAVSESNGSAVFLFFDDFNGTSLDPNKWDSYNAPIGDYDVQNGHFRMWGNWGLCCGGGCVYNHTNTLVNFSTPIAVETKFMVNGTNNLNYGWQICFATILNNTDMISISSDGNGFVFRIGSAYSANTYYFPNKGVWHRITEIFDTDKLEVKTDYSGTYLYSGSVQLGGPIGLAGDTDLTTGFDILDWIAVRKYSDASIRVNVGKPEFYNAGLVGEGPGYTRGYLHMMVQKWDPVSKQWVTVGAPVVDNELVSVPAFGSYNISKNWEADGAWSTSTYTPGEYRVIAQLFGPNYLVINNSNGVPIKGYYTFNITSAVLEVTNLTHENEYEHHINEYETGDKIDWVNVTVKAINNTAINANVTLNVLKDGVPVSWGPSGTKSCGNIPENQTCVERWDNASSGYLIPLDATSGTYAFNWSVAMNASNGPTTYNSTLVFTIHNIPSTFNHTVTKTRLYKPDWTYYNFTFTNLWSRNLTNVNVTINCPAVTGFSCTCLSSGTNTCNLGNVSGGAKVTIPFNVSVNNSTTSADYNVNVTLEYVNPGNETHVWAGQENQVIEVRQLGILEIHAVNYPINVTRGETYTFNSYINNTGDANATNAWLNYTLPPGWTNASGNLYGYISSLPNGSIMWNNISAAINITSSLGAQTVRLNSSSDNIPGDFKDLTVYVWAKTNFSEYTSNASSWGVNRGDTVKLIAKLVLDNGTAVSGETVYFWDQTAGKYIGYAVTNSTGYAVIDYTIPTDATLGYHTFNVSFSGDTAKYFLKSNTTQTIDIHSPPYVSNVNISPTNLGYGYNVSISATLGDLDGDTITGSTVKIKYPNGTIASYNCFIPPDTCNYTFNNTWQNGTYEATITVQDDTGTTNQSGPYNFTVNVNAEMSTQTMKNEYSQNEDVLLSNKTWLNISFPYRVPINVTNQQNVNLYEYQVLVKYNLGTAYSEGLIDQYCHSIRFGWLNTTSGTEEEIPYYTLKCNLTDNSTAEFWVKVPEIPANSSTTIYMYYGLTNLSDGSNISKTFSYSKPRIIGYIVSNDTASNGVIISSVSGNDTVVIGGTTYTLTPLQNATTGALEQNTSVAVTSLTQVVGSGAYDDIIVPVSFAGREFIYSGMRDTKDTICMLSPFGNANVTIYYAGVVNWTGTVTSVGTCIVRNFNTTSVVRVESNIPILAYYYGAGGDDSYPMVPADMGPWYGVPSQDIYVGNKLAGTIYINESTGTSTSQALTADGGYSDAALGADGTAPAFKVWGTIPIGAIQEADSDGTEATTFYPWYQLSTEYGAPNGMQYVAIASPYATECKLYNSSSFVANITLSGASDVYKGCYNCGYDTTVISGPWRLTCDKPVYAYYENPSAMETNLMGWLQMRQYTYPAPVIKYGSIEERPAKVYNHGNSFEGYLQMYVETNTTGNWTRIATILNDSSSGTIRDIGASGLDLASLWNPTPWNTDSETPGYYRTCAAIVSPEGNILNSSNGPLYKCHIFKISPPPTYVNITNISVYEVTAALPSNWHIYTNDYVGSGLNKTFTFYKGHVYRIEVTVKNVGNTTWELNKSNIRYLFLNKTWIINATNDIWYSNSTDIATARSDTSYEGGVWDGNVSWNTTKGGVVGVNNTSTFFFIVNVTSTGLYSVQFQANTSGVISSDTSTWQVVIKDTTPPQLYNNTYGLTNNDILRGQSTTAYARWNEGISSAAIEFNSTSPTIGNWINIILPDPNPGNWTNYTITTTSAWILGRHVAKIEATDLSNNTNDTLPYLWFNVSGLAQVTNGYISKNPVDVNNTTGIYCQVTDYTNASTPISNYVVSFYDNGTLLGTNVTNSTGWAVYNYTPTKPGYHTIICNISADPQDFYKIDNNNTKTMNLTVSETIPPQWHEVIGPSLAHKGDNVSLDVRWTDNYKLGAAVLATNATGTWANVSEMSLSGNDSWANFTYQIPTTITPGYVSWKQYANDTWGNTNVTNIQTIDVWGWSEVYAINVVPASVQLGNNTTIMCQVVDANDTLMNLSNYNVSFYDNGTSYIGSNVTNSTGWAVYNFKPAGVGTHTVKCAISNDSSKKYNASSQYYLTHALTVTAGPDTTPPQIVDDTYQINATNIYLGECVKISGQWNEALNYSKVIYNVTSTLIETHIPTPYTDNWTNYTLCTNATWTPGYHVAKLWANDTSGNINDTLPYKNFTVWGRSAVEWVSPAANANIDRGLVTLECEVFDVNYSTPIANYPVKFYDDNGYLIGEAYTNSSGIASVVYNATNRNVGPATLTCKIASSTTLYYNTTAPYDQASRTFNFYGTLNITITNPKNGTAIHRTENVSLESTVVDENGNIPLNQTGQPATLDVEWWNETTNVATGQNTSWIVSQYETLGPQTLKANVTAAYYHPDSDNITIVVYGWSTVSVVSPANNTGYKNNEIIPIVCRVTDTNTSSGIQNYPVSVYDNTTLLGTFYTNATGYVSTNESTTTLTEGIHIIKCVITDNSSLYYNASTVTSQVSVLVDKTPPSIYYNPSTDVNGTYNRNWIIVNVTATDQNLDTVLLYLNGTPQQFQQHVGDYYWSNITNLSDGTYTFYAWANDTVGNTNQTSLREVTIDTTPPTLTIVSPENKTYGVSDIWFNVSSNENVSACWYNLDGGANNSLTKLNSTYAYGQGYVPDGTHTAYFYCNDTVGNIGSNKIVFTVDTTPPNVTLNSPANATYTNKTTLVFNCSASDNIQIKSVSLYGNFSGAWGLDQTNTSAINNANYLFSKALTEGTYKWNCEACDGVNCAFGTSNWTVTVDTTPPTVTIISPANATYNNTTVDLNYTVSDKNLNDTCYYSLDGGAAQTLVGCTNTTISGLTEGRHTILVWVYDKAGNKGNASVDFTIDLTPPSINIIDPQNTTYNETNNIPLNYTVSDNFGVKTCWYSLDGGSTVALASCQNTTLLGLSNGNHHVIVYAEDNGGNVNSSEVYFTINVTNLTVTIQSPLNGSYENTTWVWVNATTNKPAGSCQYSLDGALNVSMSNDTLYHWYANASGLTEGVHNVTVYCSDNSTTAIDNSTFTIDLTNPTLKVYSPENITYATSTVDLNYSASDSNPITCYYSLDGGAYTEIVGCQNTTISSIADGAHKLTVEVKDAAGNANITDVYFSVDTTPPTLTIVSPENKTYGVSDIWFNVSSNENVSACWYNLDGGANNSLTKLNSTYAYGQGYVPDGTHTAYFYCNDTVGNIGSNKIVFTVDTTGPVITFVPPTPVDGAGLDYNWTYVNITTNEDASTAILQWEYPDGSKVNYTMISNTARNWKYNMTNLPDGTYYYTVYANDSLNNWGVSATRKVIISVNAPAITLWSPQNKTYNITNVIDLNATVSKPVVKWWMTLNGRNFTFTPNTTIAAALGPNHLTVYAEDAANKTGNSSVDFTVNTTTWADEFDSPVGIAENSSTLTDGSAKIKFCWPELTTGCWPYRRQINLTSATNLTNFQVKLVLNLSTEYNESKVNSDCSDLRFTWYNSTSGTYDVIPYWIENCNVTGNTTVWIKVPEITTTGSSVYMYYGNPNAVSESNGSAVFEFFDTMDTLSKWNVTDWVTEAGVARANASYSSITAYYTYPSAYVVDMKVKGERTSTGASGFLALGNNNNKQLKLYLYPYDGKISLYNGTYNDYLIDSSNWHIYTIIADFNNDDYKVYIDNSTTPAISITGAAVGTVSSPEFYAYNTNGTYVDWIRIRKYAPAPSTSIGNEEMPTGTGWFKSITIPPGKVVWKTFYANSTVPTGTTLIFRILNSTGDSLCGDITPAEASTGYPVCSAAQNYTNLTLYAYMSTTVGGVTPEIHSWNISWEPIKNDLSISNITFNTSEPVENHNVTVSVNVTNTGNTNLTNVKVELLISRYNGTLWILKQVMNNTINISANSYTITNYTWTAEPGTWNFTAIVDPDNNITETNETNNEYSTTYNVSGWQIMYGKVDGWIEIADASGHNFTVWIPSTVDGNLLFSDSDSNYNMDQLMPLNGTNDLREADEALNMTGSFDSIENLWDTNHDGIPDHTACFNVSTRTICNVPVINSTSGNNGNFITGILWDAGDGGTDYNGTQDLVFITEINQNKTGSYGTYDYEVRIPSALKSLKPPQNTVSVYLEVR